MKTWIVRTGLRSAAICALVIFGNAHAADDKTPDIETVMKKVNNAKDGIHKLIGTDLKGDKIDWTDVSKKSKIYHDLASALSKNDPPKGEKKSWSKLSKEYADNVKTLGDAADKKDKSAATTAHGKISRSCKTCHDAHKG